MKIRIRLTLLFTITVATILLIFSLSIYYFYSLFRENEFYDRLEDKAIETVELLTEVKTIDEEILKIIDKHDLTTLQGEEVILFDNNLKMIYKSGEEYIHFPLAALKNIQQKEKVKIKNGDRESLGIHLLDGGKYYVVVVSAIDQYGYSKLNNLLLILSIGFATGVIVIFIIGYYFSENALAPISGVVAQVDKITASNLNMRVDEGNGKDEIATLAKTFNNMLQRLEEAFMMQRNFVSNASHELRTPMTSIAGEIEVALMQPRMPEEYQSVLKSILEETQKLTKMTTGLLDLAKVSSDEYFFTFNPIRIDELLWNARSELLKKFPEYHIKIEFQNFPDEEEKLLFRGNEALLNTVFINLFENGCKFSKNKKVEVLVVIFFNKVQILVMDTGAGIAKDDLNHIFEPFYRSIKTRKINGYGIGLSLVQKIIAMHKGLIEVVSTEGVGTIFTVTIFR